MAVEVNTERMGVQVEWDPSGGETTEPPEKPDGIPTHPIYLPPYVDIGFPEDQPKPDHELPGDQPEVEQPIFLPPYVDNTLPGAVKEKLQEFLTGNLPPFEHPEPVANGEEKAVQVFAQNMADEEDWSNLPVQKNTGLALISYPKGYTGKSWIEVRALDGSLVDCGEIEVG